MRFGGNYLTSGADLALRLAAVEAWGVADPDTVIAAPGTQALIQALSRLYAPARITVLEPTYPGYAEAFAQAGHEIISCTTLEEIADGPDRRGGQSQQIRTVVKSNPATCEPWQRRWLSGAAC